MSKYNTIPLERPKRFSEVLGLWVGGAVAPIAALGSLLRQARVVHPRGIYFLASVEASQNQESPYYEIAQGLAQDTAMVRLSTGVSRGERGLLPDVLGLAIRFNIDPNALLSAQAGSQDLLMVTARSVLTLPLAPLRTNQRDFLGNVYHGMAKFELGEHAGVRLRMVPLTESGASKQDRYAKIRAEVANANAVFQLEAAAVAEPKRWIPLVRVHLQSELDIDDRVTNFWPFITGQHIRPQGFVQFLRPIPYLSSQWARGL